MPKSTSVIVSRLQLVRAAAIMAIAFGSVAPAQAAITEKVKKACKGDYQRLCPGYKIGSSQLRACMEAKQNDITWNCVQELIDAGEVDKPKTGRR